MMRYEHLARGMYSYRFRGFNNEFRNNKKVKTSSWYYSQKPYQMPMLAFLIFLNLELIIHILVIFELNVVCLTFLYGFLHSFIQQTQLPTLKH